MRIGFIATSVLVATTIGASAHEQAYDKRQLNQLGRIEAGRQTGEITWREGLKLRAEQRRISALESHFLADGRLDKRERRILRAQRNAADEHIWSQDNDGWRRSPWLPRVGR